MSNIEKQYQGILRKLVLYGKEKGDRTGTGTLSYFGDQIRHDMSEGFPLLTTKKMAIKTMMTELKWFLKGDTNIKYLVDNGCNIWNGDAYKNYEKYAMANSYGVDILSMEEFIQEIKTNDEFAKKWGELGPIYGRQWRDWNGKWKLTEEDNPNFEKWRQNLDRKGIDQISNLINDLKINPDSRRLMVNAWNVGELDQMVLPPCHYGFQVYTRELSLKERNDLLNKETNRNHKRENCFSDEEFETETLQDCKVFNIPTREISLMWNQRSVDTFLGLPFNIASYATLLQLIADECNMIAGELIGNLGDVHLYKNHIQQAKEQISREPYKLPTIELSNVDILNGEFDYEIIGYESHPTIKAPLSN
jgi:thymidylate synthase